LRELLSEHLVDMKQAMVTGIFLSFVILVAQNILVDPVANLCVKVSYFLAVEN
jgi:predicted benzoate:H+ symporter BenE